MPNKVYHNPETAVVFGSQASEVDWSTESITNDAGRQSATYDAGLGPRAFLYLLEFWTQLQATPTVGNVIRVYVKGAGSETASPDHWANDDGTGNIAVSSVDKLRNLDLVATLVVDEAAANVEMGIKRIVEIPYRHFALVFWNTSGASVTTDVAETKARLTPIPLELQ